VYTSGSEDTSGISDHDAVDEGVDNSDDDATCLRPPTSDGKQLFYMGLPGGESLPAEWTTIDSCVVRIRARVIENWSYPWSPTPSTQEIEIHVGDDTDGEEIGTASFSVDGTSWQTYEVTVNDNLPEAIEDISYDQIDALEVRNPYPDAHTFEISAIEVCLTGSSA
tara:strand:- start:183 stop:680 length:498 start_codon:yes stop_codon:yes gene_type:complete